MRRLSLPENCRRRAVATTSGSGRAPEGAFPAALRVFSNAPSGSVAFDDSIVFAFDFFMMLTCLYTLISEGQVSQVILAQGELRTKRKRWVYKTRRVHFAYPGPLRG